MIPFGKNILRGFFVLSLIFLAGCGGVGGSSTGGGAPGGIGANGGTVTNSDGKATVTIPAGALSQETAITVNTASSPPAGNIGIAYEFGPSGTAFNQPVTISITYNQADLPSTVTESSLKLGTLENNQWTEVAGSSVDVAAHSVTGTTTHFSVYGVIPIGMFSPTGSMTTAREDDHTATLLSSGKVLIVGGCGDAFDSFLSSAELYDPATGTFSATGSMITARCGHTAALLSSGKVLIAGGYSTGGSNLSSAELYDPATGTFSATGSMNTPRREHTATLLSSGKVLMAGGCDSTISDPSSINSALSSAELYDPATGTFSVTGSMTTARCAHTATLLSSGNVLIAGGYGSDPGGYDTLDTAELYDPASGTFGAIGSMTMARGQHTATLLSSGKVLIAGGIDFSTSNWWVSGAELYDPATGTFSATGSMTVPRGGHTATLLSGGKVLIAGGIDADTLTSTHASAELYDPATGTFSATGSMATARVGHIATLLSSGKVLIAGGRNADTSALTSAELYQ